VQDSLCALAALAALAILWMGLAVSCLSPICRASATYLSGFGDAVGSSHWPPRPW